MKARLAEDGHRVRVTRVYLLQAPAPTSNLGTGSSRQEGSEASWLLYNTKVVSTNKLSREFVESLELHAVVWCVNPLFKYYGQTKDTLDCLQERRERSSRAGRL